MKSIFLIRGLPGAGKTSLAKALSDGHCIVSADDYFTSSDGTYSFDSSRLGSAHEYCRRAVEDMMFASLDKIFVANTFTTEKEMKYYYDLAEKYGYRVFSIIVENRHEGISVHRVPNETLETMKHRFNIKL
jgi:predicted kinase